MQLRATALASSLLIAIASLAAQQHALGHYSHQCQPLFLDRSFRSSGNSLPDSQRPGRRCGL